MLKQGKRCSRHSGYVHLRPGKKVPNLTWNRVDCDRIRLAERYDLLCLSQIGTDILKTLVSIEDLCIQRSKFLFQLCLDLVGDCGIA